MFNWYTAPTFFVMLLFWLLAAYLLTRSANRLVSLVAVGACVCTAAYLLGQGMSANAATVSQWRPWLRNLLWGASLAPSLWYWLTVLLLGERPEPRLERYLGWVARPLGFLLALSSCFLTATLYAGDSLFRWESPVIVPAGHVVYSRFHLLDGPLFGLFIAYLAASTFGATVNVGLGWHLAHEPALRGRFAWLLASALLFVVGANTLGLATSLKLWNDRGIGLSHLLLGGAMVAMMWNVAAYSLLLRGQEMRRDALSFLTLLGGVCLLYGCVFVALAGHAYSFQLLGIFAVLSILVICSHALFEAARSALDPLFFQPEVQRLRSGLSAAVQDAALAPDLVPVLVQAEREIDEVTTGHMLRLTEEALRRINNPAGLAQSELLLLIPETLRDAVGVEGAADHLAATPLQRAQALRNVLIGTIERLRPADVPNDSPGALQYQILHEEYVRGVPNREIMHRHSISESTFHRNRRVAIGILARELREQEDRLPRSCAPPLPAP
jgi:hypothetical protein